MDVPQLSHQKSDEDDLAYGKEEAATLLPTEQIAAKNYAWTWRYEHQTWRQSYDIPHSCRHCRGIRVVKNPKPFSVAIDRAFDVRREGNPYIRLCIAEKIPDIWQAMDDNCPLFQVWFEECRKDDLKDSDLLHLFDIDGSGMLQAAFWGKGLYMDAHGYGDLALLFRKHCDLRPEREWLRAIVQPHEPRATLTCDPGAPDSFKICRDLMSKCSLSHPLCRMPLSSFIPTRLLDVTVHEVKLVETSDLEKSERHEWCALSYVWGGDVPLKTTKATQLAHKERIPLDTLPQTMKDAVSVCRGMGIRYLWIDALCIIQDDQEDLRIEVSHMPEVYQYAVLTISAASSRSIYDGFLYRRGYWSHTFPAIDIQVATDFGENIRLFVYVIMYSHAFYKRKEPILQRAWTYQEDMLSPRILNYRTHHLEWKCRTHTELAGAPEFDLLKMPMIKLNRSETGKQATLMASQDTYRLSSSKLWIDMVIEYSKREASLASDKLRALSAVARVYYLETGKEYLAGLWKEDIPAALCWAKGLLPGEPGADQFVISQRPREYRAPSWSWASIDAPVHYWGHRCNCGPVKPRPIQVLHAGITPTYPNGEFDSISSGFLVLHGPVRAWALPTPIELHEFKTKNPTKCWGGIRVKEVNAYVHLDAVEDGHEMLDTLWFFLLAEGDNNAHPDPGAREPSTTYYGLVLKEAKGHPYSRTYSRIGYFNTEAIVDPNCNWSNHRKAYTPAMFFDRFENRTITLI